MKITRLYEVPATAAQAAWRLSRDPATTTPMQDVLKVDAPVNEIPCYVLLMEDMTILEREIFTTPRNHVVWARTSRVDDPLLFTVPEEFAVDLPVNYIKEHMQAERAAGKAQDEWRSLLPVLAHTTFVTRLSLRDMVKLIQYFDYLGTKAQHFQARWRGLCNALLALLPKEHATYSLDLFLNEKPINLSSYNYGRKPFGSGWSMLQVDVPLMLRAQIVRHRPILFIDNLLRIVCYNPWMKDLTTAITMELTAHDSIWHSIIAKRNCWIAQADIWEHLTTYFNSDTLPCTSTGICPYVEDNKLRMAGKDVNSPCPIYLNLTGQPQAPYLEAIRKESERKPNWWKEHIDVS